MKKRLSFLVFLLVFLAACGGVPAAIYIPYTAPETTPPPTTVFLDLFFEQANHPLGLHEPVQGVLLGAGIKKDPTAGSIEQFNELAGVGHAIFAYTMHLGDAFPLRWVLENIAAGSASFITLMPPTDSSSPFDLILLEQFISDIALFNAPVFVQLFPITPGLDMVPLEYIAFFNRAYVMFEAAAPHVALTWGFDSTMQATAPHFFPGENAVHWINLTLYNYIDPDGYFADVSSILHGFHDAFSHIAPLSLTTAVSSYCIYSNRRFPYQAGAKIINLYGQVVNFPRLRAIIYQNYSDITGRGADFRINHTQVITNSYQTAALASHFLTSFPKYPAPIYGITSQKSPYTALLVGYRFYIPQAAFNLPTLPIVPINGRIYHPLHYVLEATGSDFFVNMELSTITIQLE